jgi:hypothetical protein
MTNAPFPEYGEINEVIPKTPLDGDSIITA